MKTSQTIEAAANLKGMAKHTYNRVMSAMAEDSTAAMLHTFAALTDGAKAIALQSGKFSNLYIRGERKEMTAEEAAKELAERAAAGVTRKLRKIDTICAVAFLAEYISRQRKADEPTETPSPENTPSTMNANETIPAAIIAELNTRKDKSAWDKGVTEYATELAESLDNWDKQPKSVVELREMMLNGADDWKSYSWGGSSLIYNQDIAERLCSPSELKRVTNKNGLRDYPNSWEHWLDVQARALYQAANRVTEIASKFFNA